MKLSLVTGTVGRPDAYARLVESIHRHTQTEWELVVAAGIGADYAQPSENIRIIVDEPQMGWTKAYNRACRVAEGEWVIWLNDDVEVLPGYDVEAIQFMEANPKLGIGALYYRENEIDFHISNWLGVPYANFGIIRKSMGDRVNWFDEHMEMYGADNSLTYRVLFEGFGISGIPEARLLHHKEDDSQRKANLRFKHMDGDRFRDKYLPLRDAIQKAYFETSR